jgi:hypothetical protein
LIKAAVLSTEAERVGVRKANVLLLKTKLEKEIRPKIPEETLTLY